MSNRLYAKEFTFDESSLIKQTIYQKLHNSNGNTFSFIPHVYYFSYLQGFNQPSQMSCNVIFPTERNFQIRSKYIFHFMFSLTFKAFVMLVTFLLFQNNLYIVLARGKGPKNSVHRDLFKTKNPKQKNPRHTAVIYALLGAWVGLHPN